MPVIRCIARPDMTTLRPAACAARAIEMMRPTLEAKVVIATRCGASAMSLVSVAATSSSLGLWPSLRALVESQISASGGPSSRPIASKRPVSVGAAAMGCGSSFQSPVWTTRPTVGGDQERVALGDRVGDVDRLDGEGADGERLARLHQGDRDIVDDLVGGALGRQHRRGEGGRIDRLVEGRPEVEHGAVVVLVAVGEDQRQDVVGIVLEEGGIGHDQLDAGLARAGRR